MHEFRSAGNGELGRNDQGAQLTTFRVQMAGKSPVAGSATVALALWGLTCETAFRPAGRERLRLEISSAYDRSRSME